MNDDPRAVLARNSKSFALAARLLPAGSRDDAAVLYAWCRRADDLIDLGGGAARDVELAELRAELEAVYGEAPLADPLLARFREVIRRRGIPAEYPHALLDGLEMDLGDVRLQTASELLLYAYRVAGVVGLMMCHVFGATEPRVLRRAADLGIAMQLTNVCRDVLEDWERRRLYLPADLLAECGAASLGDELGRPLPPEARAPIARAVARLLAWADFYYRSGDAGLGALPGRAALAVRTARLVYAAIGAEIARRDHDVTRGRAVVPLGKKLWLLARAALTEAWARLRASVPRSRRRQIEEMERSHGSIALDG